MRKAIRKRNRTINVVVTRLRRPRPLRHIPKKRKNPLLLLLRNITIITVENNVNAQNFLNDLFFVFV